MKTIIGVAAVLTGLALFAPAQAQVSIQYGIVVGADYIEEDDSRANGAVIGGMMGHAIGPRRPGYNRGTLAGAAVGAAIDESNKEYYMLYAVELMSGVTVSVKTEQQSIRQGDCVAVEQGAHANIRPVSPYHCEAQTTEPPVHHSEIADACDQAKQALVAASEEELDAAIQKVRVLCED